MAMHRRAQGPARRAGRGRSCSAPGKTVARAKGEIVASFLLPARPPRSGDAYLRFIPRTEMDIAVVGAGVSLTLDDERHRAPRRACRSARWRRRVLLVAEAAEALIGSKLDDAALEKLAAAARAACRPIDDKRGTIEYPHQGRGRAGQAGRADRARTGEEELMAKHHIAATVNGDAVEFLCEPEETLLDVLRDQLGLTGTKEGCGTGDCGACSVMLDGRLVCSCLVLGAEAEGTTVETIEGMAQGRQAASAAAASSSSTRRCSAASARRASWWRPRRCSTRTPTRPRPRSATGWPATSAAAPATTRSSARCMDAASEMRGA